MIYNYIRIIASMIANIITHIPTAFPDRKGIKSEDCGWFEKEKEIFIIQQNTATVFMKIKKRELEYICKQTH